MSKCNKCGGEKIQTRWYHLRQFFWCLLCGHEWRALK